MNNRTSKDEHALIDEEIIMPFLEATAMNKGWKVFVFRDEALRAVYPTADPNVGIALMASNEDNAIWNLKNLRRCYLIKLKTATEDVTQENQESLIS